MNVKYARKQAQRKIPLAGLVCQRCGKAGLIHRHHHDYSKPLDVEIVCASCHGKQHAMERWDGHQKTKVCLHCKKEFHYKRARETCCSLSCANKLAWINRGSKSSQILGELQTESPIGFTASKDWETRKSRSKPQSPGDCSEVSK